MVQVLGRNQRRREIIENRVELQIRFFKHNDLKPWPSKKLADIILILDGIQQFLHHGSKILRGLYVSQTLIFKIQYIFNLVE